MLCDLPSLAIVTIAEKCTRLKDIVHLMVVNKQLRDILHTTYERIVTERYDVHYPELIIQYLLDSELDLEKFLSLTNNFKTISELHRTARFQHLLRDCYNESIYRFRDNTNEICEHATFHVLLKLFHYTKQKLPHNKVNLTPWALYVIFDYVSSCIARSRTSIFCSEEMSPPMIDRLIHLHEQVHHVRMNAEIKHRLVCLLQHLQGEYGIIDPEDTLGNYLV